MTSDREGGMHRVTVESVSSALGDSLLQRSRTLRIMAHMGVLSFHLGCGCSRALSSQS